MEIRTIQKVPVAVCTGCAVCGNCCPKEAISMEADEEGFLRPVIDPEICVCCGKCVRLCPALAPEKESNEGKAPDCFAAWSKDNDIRFQSTSGGVFTHLAQAILEQGGAVIGARYRTDHLVEHYMIRDPAEISLLRQSKYVQSEIGFIYRKAETELKNGLPVLFSGTPCQCAGLRSFLTREYENLYLCDFICRGVNSPMVYLEYLRELEAQYGASVKQVWFKNKTYGWNRFATKITFEDGQEYLADRETDPYMLGYIKSRFSLYMRPSCYQCQFKGVSRPVDITLGDFWGVEKQDTTLNIKNGISLVWIHSPKGKCLFDAISYQIEFHMEELTAALQANQCAEQSVKIGENRNLFFKKEKERGFLNSFNVIMNKIIQ